MPKIECFITPPSIRFEYRRDSQELAVRFTGVPDTVFDLFDRVLRQPDQLGDLIGGDVKLGIEFPHVGIGVKSILTADRLVALPPPAVSAPEKATPAKGAPAQ